MTLFTGTNTLSFVDMLCVFSPPDLLFVEHLYAPEVAKQKVRPVQRGSSKAQAINSRPPNADLSSSCSFLASANSDLTIQIPVVQN